MEDNILGILINIPFRNGTHVRSNDGIFHSRLVKSSIDFKRVSEWAATLLGFLMPESPR